MDKRTQEEYANKLRRMDLSELIAEQRFISSENERLIFAQEDSGIVGSELLAETINWHLWQLQAIAAVSAEENRRAAMGAPSNGNHNGHERNELLNSASKKSSPTHDEIRDRWLNKYLNTAYGLGDWRRYENGVWDRVDPDTIKGEIAVEVEAAKSEGIRPAAHVLSSVVELARVKVFVPDARWNANPEILVCRNGALDILTRTLKAHDPNHYVTTALAFDYDPAAPASAWCCHLDSTIPHASNLLQEFAGYCLTADTRHETAIWLYGPRGSGKSTTQIGITSMLGNRAGILGLADIERSPFALADLPGKTLLTATEQPSMFVKSAHLLNRIISGEPITIERKYHDAYTFIPHAKILWSMNDLPRIADVNSGLFRRVKVVRFPELPEEKRDPSLKQAIQAEAPGILNWALDGLARLNARGRFEVPESVKTATDNFERQNDVPALFVADACVTGNNYKTQSQTLYNAFKTWCEVNGHLAMSSTRVADEWNRLGFSKYMAAGKAFWRGVGLIEQM